MDLSLFYEKKKNSEINGKMLIYFKVVQEIFNQEKNRNLMFRYWYGNFCEKVKLVNDYIQKNYSDEWNSVNKGDFKIFEKWKMMEK